MEKPCTLALKTLGQMIKMLALPFWTRLNPEDIAMIYVMRVAVFGMQCLWK